MTFSQIQLVRKLQNVLGEDYAGSCGVKSLNRNSDTGCPHHIRKSVIFGRNLWTVNICTGCSGAGGPIHLGRFGNLESACLMNDGYELMCKRHFSLVCLFPSDIDWLGFFVLKRHDPVANVFRQTELMSFLRDYLPDLSEDIDSVSRRCRELKHQLQASNQPPSSRVQSSSSSTTSKEDEVEEYCPSDSDNDNDDDSRSQSAVLTVASSSTPMMSSVSSPSPLALVNRASAFIFNLATAFPSCTFKLDPINVITLPMTPFEEVPGSTLMATLLSLIKRPASAEVPLRLMKAAVAGVLAKALNHTMGAGVVVVDPGAASESIQSTMKKRIRRVVDSGRVQVIHGNVNDNDDAKSPTRSTGLPLPSSSTDTEQPPSPPTKLSLAESTLAALVTYLCGVYQNGRGYENNLLNWKLKEICISSGLLPRTLFESTPIDFDLIRRLEIGSLDDDSTPAINTGDMLGSLFDSFYGRVNALRFPNDWHDESVAIFETMLCKLEGIPGTDSNIHQILFPAQDKFSFTSSSRIENKTAHIEIEGPEDLAKLVDDSVIASTIWNVFGPIISTANGFAVQSKATVALFATVGIIQTESSIARMDTSNLSPEETDRKISEAFQSMFAKQIAAADARFTLTTQAMSLIQKTVLETLNKTCAILQKRIAVENEVMRSELLKALCLTKKIKDKLKMTMNVLTGVAYLWKTSLAYVWLALLYVIPSQRIIDVCIDKDSNMRHATSFCREMISGIEVDNNYIVEWSASIGLSITCWLERGLSMIQQLNDDPTSVSFMVVMKYLEELESEAKMFCLACQSVGRLPFHIEKLTLGGEEAVGFEKKMIVEADILQYFLVASRLKSWLRRNPEQNLSLHDPIPADSSISVVFNGRQIKITFFDVLADLAVTCRTLECFITENGEGLTWFIATKWIIRIIFICNDLKTKYQSSDETCQSPDLVGNLLESTKSSCKNIIDVLKHGHPFTKLLIKKYFDGCQ